MLIFHSVGFIDYSICKSSFPAPALMVFHCHTSSFSFLVLLIMVCVCVCWASTLITELQPQPV